MDRAQGISINTIIIAVIALIVLIIIIAVFSGRMTLFGTGLDDTLTGQECSPPNMALVGPGQSCSFVNAAGNPTGSPVEDPQFSPAYFNIKRCSADEADNPRANRCVTSGWTCCVKKG